MPEYDKILKKPKMVILWPPVLTIWLPSGSETWCTSLSRPYLFPTSIRFKKASISTHFWNYPKPQFLAPKGTNPWKISRILGKFHLSKIPNMGGVYGGNDVFWGFEGCQFDFGHFWKFLKKFLKKRLFRPGEMVPSPAGFSCGSTFKNTHFSKNFKTPKICLLLHDLGVWV